MINFVKKYGFLGCTIFNTYMAISMVVGLFNPAATALQAYGAVLITVCAVIGWISVATDYAMAQYEKEREAKKAKLTAINGDGPRAS